MVGCLLCPVSGYVNRELSVLDFSGDVVHVRVRRQLRIVMEALSRHLRHFTRHLVPKTKRNLDSDAMYFLYVSGFVGA